MVVKIMVQWGWLRPKYGKQFLHVFIGDTSLKMLITIEAEKFEFT
jgi:hypothetical protein